MGTNLIVNNVTMKDAGNYVCKAVQVSSRITQMEDLKISVRVHREWLVCVVMQAT